MERRQSPLVNFGFVSRRTGAQRRLILVARRPTAKEVEFKLCSKEPESLHVKLGRRRRLARGRPRKRR